MSEKDTEFIIYTSVRGEILYNDLMPVCSIIKTITPRCRGRPDARRPSAIVHQVVHGTEGL